MTPVLGWERLDRAATGGFCRLFWVFNFSFWSLCCLQRSGMTPEGDASCLNHLCVLLIPVIVAQILL